MTFSVPPEYTAIGVADIFSHILEIYFCKEQGAYLQDRLLEGLLNTCITYGETVISRPDYYEARANIMWASSLALNGFVISGKLGDWSTHMIAHEVSAMYNVAHGLAVSIILPHWMDHVYSDLTRDRFHNIAMRGWGLSGDNKDKVARRGIAMTREFLFDRLSLPSTLSSVGVTGEKFDEMAKKVVAYGETYPIVPLNESDVMSVMTNAL